MDLRCWEPVAVDAVVASSNGGSRGRATPPSRMRRSTPPGEADLPDLSGSLDARGAPLADGRPVALDNLTWWTAVRRSRSRRQHTGQPLYASVWVRLSRGHSLETSEAAGRPAYLRQAAGQRGRGLRSGPSVSAPSLLDLLGNTDRPLRQPTTYPWFGSGCAPPRNRRRALTLRTACLLQRGYGGHR